MAKRESEILENKITLFMINTQPMLLRCHCGILIIILCKPEATFRRKDGMTSGQPVKWMEVFVKLTLFSDIELIIWLLSHSEEREREFFSPLATYINKCERVSFQMFKFS